MTAAGGRAREGLSIGAVLEQLRLEFPEVTISKIRYLESEGLVHPARSASGYRQFSGADVDRLKFVLAAQRDHYLPLKVIKEQLDAVDRGAQPDIPTPQLPRALAALRSPDGAGMAAEDFAAGPEVRLTREELLSQAGIDATALAELERFALVTPGAAGFYDPDAVQVAATVKAMTAYGIEPRHLRAFRSSADREVGLIEQIVTPVRRHHDVDSRARADELVHELAALSVTLHTLLVKSGIRGRAGG